MAHCVAKFSVVSIFRQFFFKLCMSLMMCKHLSKHCIKIANTLLGAIAICFCHVKESVLCTFADYILGFFFGMGTTAGGSTRKDSFDISKVSLSEEVSKDSEVSVHKVSPSPQNIV